MKSIWREIIMAVIMGMILPGIVLNWAVEREEPGTADAAGEAALRPMEPQQTTPKIRLDMKLRKNDGSVETMDMDAYLVGVVLAEMPSTFAQEAKKAQAVAARTFARKAGVTGGKHGDGSVCADAGCCQAYITESDYLSRGGSDQAVAQAKAAVDATSGYVLTYEGALIEATYFSCSGGSTEDAVAVWGTDFPYLRAVESPGEEHAVHYTDTVSFSWEELSRRLGIELTGDWDTRIGAATYTSGGGINTVYIGGTSFTGTQLRSLLGLRSTAFTMEPDEQGLRIETRGFGHRVGLSQYGADAMAMQGSTFREILEYYYQGATLELTNSDG